MKTLILDRSIRVPIERGNTSNYWDAKLLNKNIPNAAAVPLNGLLIPFNNSINNSLKDK